MSCEGGPGHWEKKGGRLVWVSRGEEKNREKRSRQELEQGPDLWEGQDNYFEEKPLTGPVTFADRSARDD